MHRIIALLFTVSAIAITGTLAAGEKTSPNANGASRPNVLVVIADDWSYNHASIYGCKWVETPNFDQLCRDGVSFSHCYTSNPKCFPSRASLLSGRNTWQLGQGVNHFGKYTNDFPNFVDTLDDAGYFVGFTGKGCSPGQTIGFNHDNAAGRSYQKHRHSPPYGGLSKNDYMANFKAFLKDRPDDTPFCFWLGISEPHRRYEAGSGVAAGKTIANVQLPDFYPDHDEIKSDFLDYAIEVEWFDKQLGLAIETLEKRGELDNTFIVATSDHGMPFPRIKGNVYEDAVHIPMVIRWGNRFPPGRVIDDFIGLRDLAPTILNVVGLEPDPEITGKSLREILNSDQSGTIQTQRDHLLVGKERHSAGRENGWGYPVRGIRTNRYLYKINYQSDRWPACNPETGLANCDRSPTKDLLVEMQGEYYNLSFGKRSSEELFDLDVDPHCTHNVAADSMYLKTKQQLKTKLLADLLEDKDPRTLGDPSSLLKPLSNSKYLKMKADFAGKRKTATKKSKNK